MVGDVGVATATGASLMLTNNFGFPGSSGTNCIDFPGVGGRSSIVG